MKSQFHADSPCVLKHSIETRTKIHNTMLGHRVTLATRRKISRALKGRPGRQHSAETRAKMSATRFRIEDEKRRAKWGAIVRCA